MGNYSIQNYLRNILLNSSNFLEQQIDSSSFNINISKNIQYGHLSTDMAIKIAQFKKADVAFISANLTSSFKSIDFISEISISPQNIINLRFKRSFWQRQLSLIYNSAQNNLFLPTLEEKDLTRISALLNSTKSHMEKLNLIFYEEVNIDYAIMKYLEKKNFSENDCKKLFILNKENTGFFLEYSYFRICSIIKKAEENLGLGLNSAGPNTLNYFTFQNEKEILLLIYVSLWPDILRYSVTKLDIAKLLSYLKSICLFLDELIEESYLKNESIFIIENNKNLTAARILFATVIKDVIRSGLVLVKKDL